MKPTESIAELVMKYGACDVGTLIEKLGATCDDETLLFFEGIIRVVERSSPLDANAIRHCLARHGYPVNFIEQNTDWHDSNEDNYVKNCKDVPSNLLNSIKGAIMPFVASDEQKLFYNKGSLCCMFSARLPEWRLITMGVRLHLYLEQEINL